MRPREFTCNPQTEFIQNLFEHKLRIDKRGWKESRQVAISFDKDSGVAMTRLGNTRILCSIEAQIGAPRKASRPGSGSIQFFMDILPMAHPSGTETLDTQTEECLTMLETLFRETYCIDFDTLCIEMNEYVFDLKCSLKVLDYDGGLFDCSTLAVTSALMGFKRNDVTYNGITKRLIQHPASEKPMVPLTMIYKPATVTFGFIDGIEDPIVDPTEAESVCIRGYLVVGANHRGEICLMYQSGQLCLTPEMIVKCSAFAISQAKPIVDKMGLAVYGKVEDVIMR